MSDPNASREVSVTIKVPESKRYASDGPWLVFRGDVEGVKEMVCQATGLSAEGLTLIDLTINAQRIASGLGAVSQGLGGTVLASGPAADSQPAGEAAAQPAGDVWSQVNGAQQGAAQPTEDVDPLLAQIEAAVDVPALQQIWAENQGAFNSNPSYMDSYKAKGRALSGK